MMNTNDIHLTLFLSRATPLSRWESAGIISREIAIYRQMRPHLKKISIVTSGGKDELRYQSQLGDIHILYNRWGLSPNLYSLLAPFLHYKALQRASIFKTNQLDGAWTAIIAGWLHKKPVLVRAGYLWAEDFDTQHKQGLKNTLIRWLQKFSFTQAQTIALTTEAMKHHLIQQSGLVPEKITVIPNYVDTSLFRPIPQMEPVKGRICYIGRLHPRKNLDTLIKAIAQISDTSLVLVGEGTQDVSLRALAENSGVSIQFTGLLPNNALPQEINRSEIFILPSLFEDHPKALIEAMACGAAVVGTDVPGIRNVIRHEETGLLCPPTVAGIQAALQRLLNNADLCRKLGTAARTFAEQTYSLTTIARHELALYEKVLQHYG